MLGSLLLFSFLGTLAVAGVQIAVDPDGAPDDDDATAPLTPPETVEGRSHQAGVNSTQLQGSAQGDWLAGGQGHDTLSGGAGDDSLHGERGRDLLIGGDGDDLLDGGAWHDALDGGAGNDTLIGGAGMDSLSGGDGNDLLQGGAWNDLLVGGAGADQLQGGAGNDLLIGHSLSHPDLGTTDLSAQAFHEALELAYAPNATLDDMTDSELQSWAATQLTTLSQTYPAAADGAYGADVMDGGTGNDTLYMSGDDDVAIGGEGADSFVLAAWSPNVDLTDPEAGEILDFGNGTDTLVIEYLADADLAAPQISVQTLQNGDQIVFADGSVLALLMQPQTPVTVEDITLVALMPAAA